MHKRIGLVISLTGAILLSILLMFSWLIIRPYGKYILEPSQLETIQSKRFYAGLVLGAGVNAQGRPYKELQARLNVASLAISKNMVRKLILSGDNRYESYNEPLAMKSYLVKEKSMHQQLLEPDFAGRSTYESCERVNKVFGQQKVLIISARSHLPRAIFLCRKMGVEAYGLATDVEANNSFRRELLARVKALLNVYIIGEKTVLGAPQHI